MFPNSPDLKLLMFISYFIFLFTALAIGHSSQHFMGGLIQQIIGVLQNGSIVYTLYNCCPPPYRAHEYSALGPPPHMYPHIYPTPHNNVGPTCITTPQSRPQGYGFLFRPDTYFTFLFNLPILCHKQPTSKPILKPHPLNLQRRKWRLAWYCMIFMHL